MVFMTNPHAVNRTPHPAPVKTLRDRTLKMALRLQRALHQKPSQGTVRTHLEPTYRPMREMTERSDLLWRQIGLAESHGWHAAAGLLRHHLVAMTPRTLQQTQTFLRTLMTDPTAGSAVSVQDLLAELRALQQEFGHIHFGPKLELVSVNTDPIELEGFHLGPFRIELHLSALQAGHVFSTALRCIALDPHPAGADPSITHPHVRDEIPCLGEATAPIRFALQSGRLADAFLAVQAVLNTYNPSSAYVALSEWEGRTCEDCGRGRSEEDLYCCDACHGDFCDSCSHRCDACENAFCGSCLERGEKDQNLCPDCRGRCSECHDIFSLHALDEHEGQCPSCFESHAEEDDSPIDPPLPIDPLPEQGTPDHVAIPHSHQSIPFLSQATSLA